MGSATQVTIYSFNWKHQTQRGNLVVFVMQLFVIIIPKINIPNTIKVDPKKNKAINVKKGIGSLAIEFENTIGE